MTKFIEGDQYLDRDFKTDEDVIVTGAIISTSSFSRRSYSNQEFLNLGSDGIIKAGDISSDINDINVSAAHIRATNLRVHDIYAGGINAVEIHASGNVDAIGPIYAHVLDANNISASLIDADFIRANNIKADFIICQDRVAKKVGESKTNAKVFITNKNNLEKKIGNKNISIVESSDVLFSYSKLVDASILG